MCKVNMYQAKTEFSKLVAMLESGEEDEIIIARDGKPVARMVFYSEEKQERPFGIAKGKLPEWTDEMDAEFDGLDGYVAEAFGL